MEPKAYVATSSGFSTFPIRAPPTLDSDTESSFSSESHKNDKNVSNSSIYNSDVSGFESDGFLSGEEDDFDTASERPFVADLDDYSVESSNLFSKNVGFRPIGNDPYDNSAENSDFGRKNVGFRPFENDPYDDGAESSDLVRSHVSFRPFVNDPYGDFGTDPNDTGLFKPFESDPLGEINEDRVSRAYVYGSSRERTNVKSIARDRYGDFGAKSGASLNEKCNFVENRVLSSFKNDPCGENNTNGVSKAYVSATSSIGTSVRSTEEHGFGSFDSDPDDNLNDNSDSVEDTVVLRTFVNNPHGEINEHEVSRAYVAIRDEEEKRNMKLIIGGKYGDFGESAVAEIGILETPKLIIPTAKLSRDSDEESLVFEDVEDDEIFSSSRIPDTRSLEKTGSVLRVYVSADEDLEDVENGTDLELELKEQHFEKPEISENVAGKVDLEEVEKVDGSKTDPELDEKLFEKPEMGENVVEYTELQSADYTCSFVDETKDTFSTKLMEFVNGYDDKNDSTDEIKDSNLVEIDFASSMKREDLGEKKEDGPQRSYNVFDPLLISSFDFEFNEVFKDKEGYGKFNSERSFSIDDYSNGSLIDEIEQISSPKALEESLKVFIDDIDTSEESERKVVFDPNTYGISPKHTFSEEQRKNIENLQLIRVKFYRLVQRLGLAVEDSIATQFLYRLNLIERGPLDQLFTFVSAMTTAMELDHENGKVNSVFSLNILIIGKTGVGKSATINSIFGEEKVSVSAFEPVTTSIKEIFGTIDGIRVRIFDTPGLRPSPKEQSFNMNVLSSTTRLLRKCAPDIVLYVDRLDLEKDDFDELSLLRSITRSLGSQIWQKAIITLTHANSNPPNGPNGLPLNYDLYVAQRLRNIQGMISQSLGNSILNLNSMSSVSLVENHSSSEEDGIGEKLLLNGEKWRPRLLLLCSSMKILSKTVFGADNNIFDHPKVIKEGESNNDQLLPLKLLTQTHEQKKGFLNGLDQCFVNSLGVGFSLGQGSNVAFRAGLNDKLNGQVSVKMRGLEQLQIVLLGIFSVFKAIVSKSS